MATCYTPDVSMFPYYPSLEKQKHKELFFKVEMYDDWVKDLKEARRTLEHKNAKLQKEVDTMLHEYNEIKELYADRDRVKKQNEELNRQIKDVRKQMENTEKLNKKLNDEIVVCKKEVDTIKDAVENECEASGIMEVMNTRIENAEKMERKVLESYYIEKQMNKCHVEKINHLQDTLRHKFNKESCCHCENWFDMAEIEEVLDEDYEPIDVCVNCRDNQGYTQCSSCMEYVDNSLVDTEDECSRCNGIRNEDTSSDED